MFRARPLLWAMPVWVLVTGLVNARVHPLFLIGVPFALGYGAVLVRTKTVVDAEGLTIAKWRGAERLSWADVAAVRKTAGGVAAVTHDGTSRLLPWVEWRPVVPSDPEYVYPRSGQAVAELARAAGHDVALQEAAPA